MATAIKAATAQQTAYSDAKFNAAVQTQSRFSAVSLISQSSAHIATATASAAAAPLNGRDLLNVYVAEPAMHRFLGDEFSIENLQKRYSGMAVVSLEALRKHHIQKMPSQAVDAAARAIATAVRKEAEEAQILEFPENRGLHFFNVIPLVNQMNTHLVHFFNYIKHKISTEMTICISHHGRRGRGREDQIVRREYDPNFPQLDGKTVAEKAVAIRTWLIIKQEPLFYNLSEITVRGLRALPREIGFFKPETLDLAHNPLTHLPLSLPTPRTIFLGDNQFATVPKVLLEERMKGVHGLEWLHKSAASCSSPKRDTCSQRVISIVERLGHSVFQRY